MLDSYPSKSIYGQISNALSGQTNLSKAFQSFFIETMELILTHTGRFNFTQLARCGRSCESRFRQNFKKSFDWLSFNRTFLVQDVHGCRLGCKPRTRGPRRRSRLS